MQKQKARLRNIEHIANTSVLLNNNNAFVPMTKLAQKKIVSINLGFDHQSAFDSLLNKYAEVKSISADKYKDSLTLNNLEDDLKFEMAKFPFSKETLQSKN